MFVYILSNLIVSGGNKYLTVDYFIEINNIMIGSINITLRKVNTMPYWFDKMYMDKDLIDNKFYQKIDQYVEQRNYIYKVLFESFKQNTSILWWKWNSM